MAPTLNPSRKLLALLGEPFQPLAETPDPIDSDDDRPG